jgi:hypothetical protein
MPKGEVKTRRVAEGSPSFEEGPNLIHTISATATGESAMKNSIFVIKPYRWESMWVFDDANVGLVKEPFVSGADTMIDVATAHIPNASQGFVALFSVGYFPDAKIVLSERKATASSTAGPTRIWKAGSVRPCSSILSRRRRSCTSR